MPSGGPLQLTAARPPLDAASNALHDAVDRENPGGVTRAIKRGADVESLEPESGETVLMLAGRRCNVKVVDLLLKAGASVSTPSVERYTALHTACLGGNPSIVRRLLKRGASVTSRTMFGDTPLISAALRGHKESVELLLEAGADINASDQNGRTGLMWASTHGRGDMVARLLAAGAKHDLHDDKGAQALHNATEREMLGAMAALLRAGANPNTRRTGSIGACTPLHMTVKGKHLKAARLLLRAGAVPDVKDHVGMTQLHTAICDGYTDMVSEMLSQIRQRDTDLASLEGHGLDKADTPSETDDGSRRQRQQQQQQHRGEYSTAGPCMRQVLSARNNQGWTALHIAAMVYNVEIVNQLLRYGALETEKDIIGETPFLYPMRCVQGKPIPVLLNVAMVVPDIASAVLIVQSLSKARARRALSWLFPAPASEGTIVVAAPASANRKKRAIAVRVFRISGSKRNSVFARATRRYVETKGHVMLDDGRILARKRNVDKAAAGRQLAVV